MLIEVTLYLREEDDLENILESIRKIGASEGFEIKRAEAIQSTGFTEAEIAFNLLLNFVASIAATGAIEAGRALIASLRRSHDTIVDGAAELAEKDDDIQRN